MRKFKNILYLTFLLSFIGSISFAQNDCFPKRPNSLVYDETGTLTRQQKSALENKLNAFDRATSTQIVVVLVKDLCGMDRSMYAIELGHEWGVGQEGKDNGVVVLVKPKSGSERGRVFIATGYGIEGVLPDAIGKRIVENEMIPKFKQGDMYGGIDAGVNVVMEITKGEYTADQYREKTKAPKAFNFIPILFLILIFIFVKTSGARSYARRNDVGFWMALWMMSSMGSHRGSYGSFSSGRGSFGGGGGGFSGFGGGGFGGGGAGGSW